MLYDKWERVISFPFVVYIQGTYIQGSQSPRKRSLLGVNEHFEGEHNAAIFVLPKLKKSYRAESARLAKREKPQFT